MDDGAAVVGLRSEVDDDIDLVAAQGIEDAVVVTDVASDEDVAIRIACGDVGEVRRIRAIGQQVVVHHSVGRMAAQPIADEVRTDEAGTAGYQDVGHELSSLPAPRSG